MNITDFVFLIDSKNSNKNTYSMRVVKTNGDESIVADYDFIGMSVRGNIQKYLNKNIDKDAYILKQKYVGILRDTSNEF